MGSHSLLQGIFLTQGSNPCLLHCRQILYCLSHQGWKITPTLCLVFPNFMKIKMLSIKIIFEDMRAHSAIESWKDQIGTQIIQTQRFIEDKSAENARRGEGGGITVRSMDLGIRLLNLNPSSTIYQLLCSLMISQINSFTYDPLTLPLLLSINDLYIPPLLTLHPMVSCCVTFLLPVSHSPENLNPG